MLLNLRPTYLKLPQVLFLKGWGGPKQPTVWGDDLSRPNPDSTAVEQLLKMEPEVECTEDSMQLQVRNAASTPGSLFFVDRGKFSLSSRVMHVLS